MQKESSNCHAAAEIFLPPRFSLTRLHLTEFSRTDSASASSHSGVSSWVVSHHRDTSHRKFPRYFHWPFSHRDFSCWGVFLSPGIKKTQPSETNSCERNPGGRWPSDKRQPSKRHPSGTKSKAQPVRENPVRGSPVRERPVRERSHRPWQFDGSVSRFSRHLPRFSP